MLKKKCRINDLNFICITVMATPTTTPLCNFKYKGEQYYTNEPLEKVKSIFSTIISEIFYLILLGICIPPTVFVFIGSFFYKDWWTVFTYLAVFDTIIIFLLLYRLYRVYSIRNLALETQSKSRPCVDNTGTIWT
jgi:hypothetical protein